MNSVRRYSFLVSLFSGVSMLLAADTVPVVNSAYRNLAEQFTRSCAGVPQGILQERFGVVLEGDAGIGVKQHETAKRRRERLANLVKTAQWERETIYQLFGQDEERIGVPQKPVQLYDDVVWRDLRLFCGDFLTPHEHLFSKLDHTITRVGGVRLARLIARPVQSKELLLARQAFVKQLAQDTELRSRLQKIIKKVAANESALLSFWGSSIDRFNKIGLVVPSVFDKKSAELSGMSKVWLTIKDAVGTSAIGEAVLQGMFVGGTGCAAYKSFKFAYHSGSRAYQAAHGGAAMSAVMHGGVALVSTVLGLGSVLGIIRFIKLLADGREHLSKVATAITSGEELLGELTKQSTVGALEELERLKQCVDRFENEDLNELIDLLGSSTFDEGAMLFNPVRVAKTFSIMRKQKDRLAGIMKAVGEVDAYCSVAELYTQYESLPNHFCFPAYVDGVVPQLDLVGVWDPFIDPLQVVPNSIDLGGAQPSRDAVISGPNAGGKSTFMRAILAGVLLGQTIGIAPAAAATFTPFSYLDSYVMVTDDPTRELSLFQAEVLRVSELMQNSATAKLGLVIADEIFNGTNKDDASAISRAVLEKVANDKGTIWIVATHYPQVRAVAAATGGIFANYRVLVERNPDGSLKDLTFKIEPGITSENTSIDILEQEQMPSAIVQRARELVGKQH